MAEGAEAEYRALVGDLAGLVRLAHAALRGVTAVLAGPEAGHEGIAAAEKALAELRERIEEDAARAPGGQTGLVLAVHVGCQVEALGQIAQRLLEAAWARQEREPFDRRLRTPLNGLAHTALALVGQAADALETPAPEDEADARALLAEVERRQHQLYALLRGPDGTADAVDVADLVLLSCCYRQCAGLAVAITGG
ncbi:hypothetical protein [Kitasatospora sp. NPDC101183]|uniref:hypothetical protein n=1 Tax=Kitasatospora sp. NPDC101183 TaxID=3364100 RepID=UPI003800D8D0